VHGEFQDCTQWKENFNDCKKWSESADEEAAKRVVERERARIAERLKAHFSNDVWERRTAPPDDWNKPLPDHLADAAEDSLLRVYRENHNQIPSAHKWKVYNSSLATSGCTIL